MAIEAVHRDQDCPRCAVYVADPETHGEAICIGNGDANAVEADREHYEYAGDADETDDSGLE